MTRRLTFAAVPLALLVLAAPAAGKDGRGKTSYRAVLGPVAAEEPAASASRRGRDAKVRGKAVLVDGRRRDRVKVRVRGLDRGVDYTWEIRQAGGGEGACAGEAVGGFRYRPLRVRRGGAKGRGASRSFTAAEGATYALVVSGPGGDVACGEFGRKGGKKQRGGDEAAGPACDDAYGDDPAEDEPGEYDDELAGDEPLAEQATNDPCDDEPGDESGDDSADDGGEDAADDASDDSGDAADDSGDDFEDEDF